VIENAFSTVEHTDSTIISLETLETLETVETLKMLVATHQFAALYLNLQVHRMIGNHF
jgi:hypothetical protein